MIPPLTICNQDAIATGFQRDPPSWRNMARVPNTDRGNARRSRATGTVSINVAFTGFCPIGNILQLFGFTPMLGTKVLRRVADFVGCASVALIRRTELN